MPAIHRYLLGLNERASEAFVAAESARARHRARHPTPLAAVKCMDGRVLFPQLTGTPVGLVQPFRAIGGRPEVFWPSFMGRLRHWVESARAGGHRCVLFLTYHYSASDPHLGCAGFDYDTGSARAHAYELARDLGWVFGEQLEPIVCGIETDLDRLILHGTSGEVDGGALVGATEAEIEASLLGAFPSMDPQIRGDLVPLVAGNAARVRALSAHPKPATERSHHERVIAVGQGFDWLHEANLALIINDADPDLAHAIRVASRILAKNMESAPAGDDAALVSCIPYHEPGIDRRQAVARSLGLLELARRVMREVSPALLDSGRLHAMAGVLFSPARRFERIEEDLRARRMTFAP
ncbi:MAG: carboxysome shell carbonic anhydrase [Sandaracinaceae bacterium]|nr:carboxysome shell carbonic anhydrase [Sandaracinaceae bacterium]